jgi:hypothetical protein
VSVLTLSSESAVDLIDFTAVLQAAQMRLLRVRYVPGPPIVYSADFDREGEQMTEADIAAVVAQINARTALLSGLKTPPT